MDYLDIILDVVILVVLAIPIIQGFRSGLVKMILRFGKFVVSFIFSCVFCKKLGVFLHDKWIYSYVHQKINTLVEQEMANGTTIDNVAEALPGGLKKSLSVFGVDVSDVAGDLAASGEEALTTFVDKISNSVASIASVVIAFAALFVVGMLVFLLLGKLLNAIVTRIPVVKTINTWLGGALGGFIGIVYAWGFAQIAVAILGFFAMVESYGVVLSFFHSMNPLGWLLGLMANGLYDITSL